MSQKIISYKGTSGTLDELEKREHGILQDILDIGSDLLDEALLKRLNELRSKYGGDAGYFYCPYIPLQVTGKVVDWEN